MEELRNDCDTPSNAPFIITLFVTVMFYAFLLTSLIRANTQLEELQIRAGNVEMQYMWLVKAESLKPACLICHPGAWRGKVGKYEQF